MPKLFEQQIMERDSKKELEEEIHKAAANLKKRPAVLWEKLSTA